MSAAEICSRMARPVFFLGRIADGRSGKHDRRLSRIADGNPTE